MFAEKCRLFSKCFDWTFCYFFKINLKSAEDFVKCINQLTDNDELKISKEMIKKLFSIEAEKDVARSLYMQTTHRPVVPSELADLFECPDVSIASIEICYFYTIFSIALRLDPSNFDYF